MGSTVVGRHTHNSEYVPSLASHVDKMHVVTGNVSSGGTTGGGPTGATSRGHTSGGTGGISIFKRWREILAVGGGPITDRRTHSPRVLPDLAPFLPPIPLSPLTTPLPTPRATPALTASSGRSRAAASDTTQWANARPPH